jgi:hypothetical protein
LFNILLLQEEEVLVGLQVERAEAQAAEAASVLQYLEIVIHQTVAATCLNLEHPTHSLLH